MLKEKLIYLNEIESDYKQKINILNCDPELKDIEQQLAIRYVKSIKCNCVTIFEKNYPRALKLLPQPPLVIYYCGNLNLINNNLIAIVGDKSPCEYSLKATRDITKSISNTNTIISNYGFGNSQVALLTSIKSNINAIATICYGFNLVDYNKSVILNKLKDTGLVISIIPPNSIANRNTFFQTNQLIALLSNKLLVMEARVNSAQIYTANQALDYAKEIYALPGNIYDENFQGCNNLIQDGANVLYLGIEI